MSEANTSAPEQATKVSLHQSTNKAGVKYDEITVVIADLHLHCDAVNDRQIRLAKKLADTHGCMFYVATEVADRVDRALAGLAITKERKPT